MLIGTVIVIMMVGIIITTIAIGKYRGNSSKVEGLRRRFGHYDWLVSKERTDILTWSIVAVH